jgi:IclR family transcriptional regulator, acetate operon repressor
MSQNQDSQSALARGINLLEWIVSKDRPVTSAEAADALELPKPTVHRIAQQLEALGVLQRAPNSKRFTGGPRLHKLAQNALAGSVIGASRHAILQSLSEEINETVNCVVLEGNRLVYFDRVEANWPMRVHLPVGTKVPLHATASGKLFLALMPLRKRRQLLDQVSLVEHTPLTVTDFDQLETELASIRKQQVGIDRGEFLDGLISLAVPVFDSRKRICFSIAVHAASVRRELEELHMHLPAMRRAASRLADLHNEEVLDNSSN